MFLYAIVAPLGKGTLGSENIVPTARRLGFAWDLPPSY